MKKSVLFPLVFLFGSGSLWGVSALDETGFTNISWSPVLKTQLSVICENGVGLETLGSNMTSGEKFLPTLYSIKKNVSFRSSNMIPGENCYEYGYDTYGLVPAAYILPEYQTYANLVSDYNTVLATNEGITGDINTETANYEDLKTAAAELEVVMSNILYDIRVNTEELNYDKAEEEELTAKRDKLVSDLDIQRDLEGQRTDLEGALSGVEATLTLKLEELADTKANYVVSGDLSVAESLGERNLGDGAEYNVAEYLDMYIKVHQSDIRTSKATEHTIMDLDTMSVNFLQTNEVR